MRFDARGVVVAAAAMLGAAVSARAVEPLTGTYVQQYRCQGLYDGQRYQEAGKDDVWYLDDLGNGHLFLHYGDGGALKFHGWVETAASDPSEAIAGFVDCGASDAVPQADPRVFKVKTAPGKVKATLRGTGLGIRGFGASICKLKLVRISYTIPPVDSTCQ